MEPGDEAAADDADAEGGRGGHATAPWVLGVARSRKKTRKATAQSLIAIVSLGLGRFLGSLFAGGIRDVFTADGVTNWTAVFLVPCALTTLCAIAFLVFFRERAAPNPQGAVA